VAATQLPDGSGTEEGGIVAEINVTPLTDVFLVLLIIFMVTTSVIQEGKNIELPEGRVSEETPSGVVVSVTSEGEIQVNDRVILPGQLQSALEQALESAEDKIVILKGDKRVLLGQAVNILDVAQQAGAKGIALATTKPAG
jgi:biopolymer transport protein ExbD